MSEIGKTNPILRKSYEISYALWRLSAHIADKAFADKICQKAVELMGYAVDNDVNNLSEKLPGLEYLIRFGSDVGSIGVSNAVLLIQEIGKLFYEVEEAKIENFAEKVKKDNTAKDIDLSDIFRNKKEEIEEIFPETKIELEEEEIGNGNKNESIGSILSIRGSDEVKEIGNPKSEIRQSAILERIRQIGNCRLNDIQEILPDISDRTIRYDLESLVQRKLIERIGTGGRSVYYRIAPLGGQ